MNSLQKRPSADRLLRHDLYHPEDLADLLDMDVELLRRAVFTGDLRAIVIDHRIISIRREDILDWLARHDEQ